MAEIGLIASVIQVAGAGLTLADTLYQYADSVSSADKRIKDIAKDVKLTSRVIDELGSIFKKNETALLLSKNAVSTAEETVLECSSLFEEMDAAIKKTKKSTLGKLMFPFQAPKMELLRANIDRLKSTLQLLMQVLTHAYQVASHNVDKEAAAAQRHQIKILIKAKKESTKRYEESLKNYSPSDDSIVLNDNASTTRDRGFDPDAEQSDGMVKAATIFGSTINKSSLKSCVAHIQKLLEDIELVQRCLSSDDVGAGHSEHQQRLIGSYFNAREHLDTVILGGSSSKRTDTGLSGSTAGKGQRIATADLGAAGIASIKDAPKNERHIVGAVIGGLGAAAVASDNTFEFPTYASMDPQLAQSLRMKYEEEKAREEHEKKAKEAAKNKTELENMPDEDLEAELEKAFKEYAALKSDVSDFQAEIGHIGDGKNHGTNQVWRKPTQRDELDELLRKIQDMKKELHDYVWSPEFGLGSSPPSSYPDKSIGDSPALQNLHNSAFGDDARNGRGDFLGSSPPDSTDQQADSSEKDAQAEEERKVSKNLEEEEDFEKRVEEELRKRLVILGFQDSPIGCMIEPEKEENVQVGLADKEPGPQLPIYIKVHRDHVAIDTLQHYDLPWKYDDWDANYIVILRPIDQTETEMIFEHTRKLQELERNENWQYEDAGLNRSPGTNSPTYETPPCRSQTRLSPRSEGVFSYQASDPGANMETFQPVETSETSPSPGPQSNNTVVPSSQYSEPIVWGLSDHLPGNDESPSSSKSSIHYRDNPLDAEHDYVERREREVETLDEDLDEEEVDELLKDWTNLGKEKANVASRPTSVETVA